MEKVLRLELRLYNARAALYERQTLLNLFNALPKEQQIDIVNRWYNEQYIWLIDYMDALADLGAN